MTSPDQLLGYVERITFQNSMTGFTVAALKQTSGGKEVCIVGTLPSLRPGETIRCHGSWKQHAHYGKQFEISEYQVESPIDVAGIRKYLASGMIRGIGKTYADRIVDAFGKETLQVIDKHPETLLKVEGIGQKRLEMIIESWEEQKHVRSIMIFLQQHGCSPSFAQKIYKHFGQESIQKVSQNPFNLAREIPGIGFKTADTIAQSIGFALDHPQRLESALEHLLQTLSQDGHTCYPLSSLVELGTELIEVSTELLHSTTQRLVSEQRVIQAPIIYENCGDFLWLPYFFYSEVGISQQLGTIVRSQSKIEFTNTDQAVEKAEKFLGIHLADQQKLAVKLSLQEKFHIITGGPGTGKSTITKAILKIFSEKTGAILLAAPTGRAAKRLSEITQREAKTIHSLLEFDFKGMGFKKNKDNPLEADLIIVDEASMIDTLLMNHLLKAIPKSTRVIFVGDVCQLPSVGAGNVLRDMISSQQFKVTTLTEIFRQAAGSEIILNAHRINEGKIPLTQHNHNSDFFFLPLNDPEEIKSKIVQLITTRLPKRYQFDPQKDIQLLIPMRRGPLGIDAFNELLQSTLNPRAEEKITRGMTTFKTGDKVMQLRNNYKKEVFNGDIGWITSIDESVEEVCVDFEGKEVVYTYSELDEISLAYAISIHKYQGSECPCVIMPVHTSHFKLLHRNLLYTGVTRAKKILILIGTMKALAIAVGNDEVKKRYTGLKQSLYEINLSPQNVPF